MGRLVATTVAVAVGLSSCATPAADPMAGALWAAEAEVVASLLEAAYDTGDPYEMARFFTAGGTLDLTAWGLGLATTPSEVVSMMEEDALPTGCDVDLQHLFVGLDGAAIWWYSYDENVTRDWIQTYTFGDHSRAASRAFRPLGAPHRPPALEEHTVLTLIDRYLEAWNGGDPAALEDVYSTSAVVIDDIRRTVWRGLDEITNRIGDDAPVQLGPWPSVFTYRSGAQVEAIVVLQTDGACPMLEASRWSLDGDHIAFESTYIHVPSARRCLNDLEDGWWATFELGPSLDENVTGILDSGGLRVDLVNASASQMAFARWMVDRFRSAGLGVPEVRAIWFPPSPDCHGRAGLAIESDERYRGLHTIRVCTDRIADDETLSGWAPSAIAYGLHEIAHVWMLDHLDDSIRTEFLDRSGLEIWRGSEADWHERGVEHAAFTIAWGLTGTEDATYPIRPTPDCDELAERFELLTGHAPITRCIEIEGSE